MSLEAVLEHFIASLKKSMNVNSLKFLHSSSGITVEGRGTIVEEFDISAFIDGLPRVSVTVTLNSGANSKTVTILNNKLTKESLKIIEIDDMNICNSASLFYQTDVDLKNLKKIFTKIKDENTNMAVSMDNYFDSPEEDWKSLCIKFDRSVAKSMASIVMHSSNSEFRSKIFKMLKFDDGNETVEEIFYKNLNKLSQKNE